MKTWFLAPLLVFAYAFSVGLARRIMLRYRRFHSAPRNNGFWFWWVWPATDDEVVAYWRHYRDDLGEAALRDYAWGKGKCCPFLVPPGHARAGPCECEAIVFWSLIWPIVATGAVAYVIGRYLIIEPLVRLARVGFLLGSSSVRRLPR